MNIVIKIIDGDKIIDYDSLSDKEKKEYGQRLNEQALTSLGYVRKEEICYIHRHNSISRKNQGIRT